MQTITFAYRSRNGQDFTKTMTLSRAMERLAYLDKVEADTVRYAPTDSGTVRFNYNAEAKALSKALSEVAA